MKFGKIYQVINKTYPNIRYVGSSQRKYLSDRMSTHRADAKRIPHYFMNSYGGINNWYIELIEIIEFWDKDQLRKAESWHRNKIIREHPEITLLNQKEPYHSDCYAKKSSTREKEQIRKKQWELNNKDRLKCENPKCNFKCSSTRKYALDRHYRSKTHKDNLIKTKIVKKSHPYNDKNIAKSINKTIPFCL